MNIPSVLVLGFFLILRLSAPVTGQVFEKEVYSVTVSEGSRTIEHPFTGGIYNPMHQFVDIDFDGDPDLFVFEPSDGRFSFFRNEGTASSAMFRFERDPFVMPDPFGWFRLDDVNGDAKMDLMTAPPSASSLAIYLNSGTLQVPEFSLWTTALSDSAGQAVYAESYSLSSFTDMDADGDPDFLSLNTSAGTINYYENIGTPAAPLLAFRTNRYQDIQICIGCGDSREGRHGNGALHLSDIDRDGDHDLLYGDLFHTGLYFFENTGNPEAAVLDSVTAWFPFDNPVITTGFNQPTLVDIDNDGDRDLFVSVMASLVGVDNFRLFTNESTSGNLTFVEATRNYLETVDLGLQSAPVFVDIDADGDQDLFVGNLDGEIALFRNTGSSATPAFLIEDTAIVTSATSFLLAPTFADIDADGDQDLFVGHFGGKIEFHRNTGSAVVPVFEREPWLFDTLSIGSYTGPAFMDAEGDGDLDLFIGRSIGTVTLYRNDGTPQLPRFTFETASFQGMTVGGNAKPLFVDEESDGDLDLLIGASDGSLHFFRNEGPPDNPAFSFVTDEYAGIDPVWECAPAAADFDGDGDVDLLVGCQRGGLDLYRRAGPTSVDFPDQAGVPRHAILFQNYPNPFNGIANIEFQLIAGGEGAAGDVAVNLTIYDMLGRVVATLADEEMPPGIYQRQWNATGLPSGVYWYRLRAGRANETKRLVLIR